MDEPLVFCPGSGGLSEEERTRVREYFGRLGASAEAGLVGGGTHRPEVRRSRVAWLGMSEETSWLFSRVFSLAHAANQAGDWNFELAGPHKALQLSSYQDAELGAFDWHLDLGAKQSALRKVSVAIEIDRADEGGVLQFRPGVNPHSVDLQPGAAVVFPAYLPHRLTPVTKGQRLSLVSWICGPPFR
jgi:PKHD-type hydroxylase